MRGEGAEIWKPLPTPTVTFPALLKLPPAIVVVSNLPDRREKEPVLIFVAKFARALAEFRSLMIWEVLPVKVILAALDTMLAPSKPSAPLTIYLPPVRVEPEKLLNKPPVMYMALFLATFSVPVLLLLKLPLMVNEVV